MESVDKKKIFMLLGVIILAVILISMYLGIALFFMGKFFFGTTIDGIDVGGLTPEQARVVLLNSGQTYTVALQKRDGEEEKINGADIGLAYTGVEGIYDLKSRQKAFLWPIDGLADRNYRINMEASYDEQLLEAAVNGLECMQSENVTAPVDASVIYSENEFVIDEGNIGDELDREKLETCLREAILEHNTKLDLEELDCYKKQTYTAESEQVIAAKDTLNSYLKANITYHFDGDKVVIAGNEIKDWLDVSKDFEVTLNEDKVNAYVDELSNDYNTLGSTRSFKTHSGKVVQVSGGDYGNVIDMDTIRGEIMDAVKSGKTVNKEVTYLQKAYYSGKNDIGSTYVEVSLTNQHLWFYKDGQLLTDGPVVTGDQHLNRITPQGTYKLDYKQRNAILRGPGYATPVSFWMPFNRGIGIHDAVWRGSFGGSIYITNGSHGCVNAPYSLASTIFDHIEQGMPVICYYE